MKIAIGSDHAGFEYKQMIISLLKKQGIEVYDKGPFTNESVDYPDYAHPVAVSVEDKEAVLGILICGSGNGVCMTANKHKSIRAALCWTTETAILARAHNDANILCLPARFISKRMAKNIVLAFINNPFEAGRHEKRVHKIPCN